MKKGDMVCSKDKSIVGVIIDFVPTMQNVTLAVLWNKPPTAQGCKTFVIHEDNIEPLPKGTIIKQITSNGNYLKCKYNGYDNKRHIIYDADDEHNLLVLGDETYDFTFIDDNIETKNNKQYTCLTIEPWEIMKKDFTREEFVGFLKGNIIKYCLRKKGSDLQDFEKVEHYAKKLQEVLKGVRD